MLKRLAGAIAVGVFALGASVAYAGVAPNINCKDKKGKEAGKYTLAVAKAFGKNGKKPNTAGLTKDLSKARSKITKGFTKAEYKGSGASQGCDTTNDVVAIRDKGDMLVEDNLDELGGAPPCVSDCTGFTTLSFVTGSPAGTCGRINDASGGGGTNLNPFPTGTGPTSLDCGTLYIGGGASAQPPSPTPDGATTILNVNSSCTLSAATSLQTGSNRNCSAPGCTFGPPLPIPNPGATGVSTCVINAIAASPAAGGTLDCCTGASTQTLPLTVTVRGTGDLEPSNAGIQPCPTCQGGQCQSGGNSGGTCTTTTSLLTSHDCLPTQGTLAPFGVDLSPLQTGTATLAAAGGTMCTASTGQRTAGCMGQGTCAYIEENGSPSGNICAGNSAAAILASTFCIPSSGDALINTVADLPGPGAVSLTGTTDLN